MTNKPIESVLRLRKKHSPAERVNLGAADGKALQQRQSLHGALLGGVIVVILFSVLWAMLSTLSNRIFPWMTIVLGIFVGLAVRHAGRGLDWRFPVLAAAITVLGALVSNIVVAAAFTAAALQTSTLTILRAVTAMTWPVYFDEVISAADVVYALFGAATAAFYANRRLTRAEYHALRKYQEEQNAGRH